MRAGVMEAIADGVTADRVIEYSDSIVSAQDFPRVHTFTHTLASKSVLLAAGAERSELCFCRTVRVLSVQLVAR